MEDLSGQSDGAVEVETLSLRQKRKLRKMKEKEEKKQKRKEELQKGKEERREKDKDKEPDQKKHRERCLVDVEAVRHSATEFVKQSLIQRDQTAFVSDLEALGLSFDETTALLSSWFLQHPEDLVISIITPMRNAAEWIDAGIRSAFLSSIFLSVQLRGHLSSSDSLPTVRVELSIFDDRSDVCSPLVFFLFSC
jgi:hypothetical protein